jgi:hypothetical protein
MKDDKFLHCVQNDRYPYFSKLYRYIATLNIPAVLHTERSEEPKILIFNYL